MQIAVIAKEPIPGRVKTRMCPPFTPDEAASLAAAALADTLQTVAHTPATRRVLVLDGRPGSWLPPGFDVIPQRGDGLAERLDAAFADCTSSCSEPVVLVGMDTPQLTAAHMLRAGALLHGSSDARPRRAVVGPAADGGYWLLGLSTMAPRLFEGVAMSRPTTLSEQVGQLRARRFEVCFVDELVDIDTAKEAEVVAREVPDSRFAQRFQDISSPVAVA